MFRDCSIQYVGVAKNTQLNNFLTALYYNKLMPIIKLTEGELVDNINKQLPPGVEEVEFIVIGIKYHKEFLA